METLDYSIINDILIDNYDLIIPKYSVIYQYCYKHNIKRLSELIFKYNSGEIYSLNRKTNAEIYGLIELIIYRHFNKNLSCESLFFDELKIYEDMWKGEYKKDWAEVRILSTTEVFPIRRLGFSTAEENKIKSFVKKQKEDMLIINAIMSYKNAFNKPVIKGCSKGQEVFEKKLDLLLDYYNKKYLPCIESDKLRYLSGLLNKYKKILIKKSMIDNELIEIVKKIDEEKHNLGENNVKKMLKLHGLDDI